MVVVQAKDETPWTHGAVVGHGIQHQSGGLYKIHVTKTSNIITRTVHVILTQITTEQKLRD